MDIKDSQIVFTLQAFNAQLESIRTRYNELDPLDDLPDDDLFDSNRSSIDSTRGVSNQPWIIEELPEGHVMNRSSEDLSRSSEEDDAWARQHRSANSLDTTPKSKAKPKMSKVVNWFKDTLQPSKSSQQMSRKPSRNRLDVPEATTYPYALPSGAEVHSLQLPESNEDTPALSPSDDLTISNPTSTENEPRAPSPTLTEAEDQSSNNTFPYQPSSPGADQANFYHFEVC